MSFKQWSCLLSSHVSSLPFSFYSILRAFLVEEQKIVKKMTMEAK